MPRRPETPQVTPLGPERARSGEDHGRRPGAILLLAAAAAALVLLVLVFGAGGGNDQEPPASIVADQANEAESPNIATTTTTTTTTVPPTLAQIAPEIAAGLTIVTTGEKARALRWTEDGEPPRHRPLPTDMDWAAFDVDGEHLAYTDGSGLSVGDTFRGEATTVARAVTGAVWHPSRSGVIAFTALGSEAVTLTVARLDRDPGGVVEMSEIAELPNGSRIVAWGPSGYLVEQPLPGTVDADAKVVVAYDRSGHNALRAVPGTVVTAGRDLLVVAGPENVAGATAAAESAGVADRIVPPGDGIRLLDHRLTPVAPGLVDDAGQPPMTIAPDGSAFATSTRTSPRSTSVTLMARDSRSSMIVPVEGSITPIGFVGSDVYLLLHDAAAGELVLINTDTGRRDRLPLGVGTVLAAHA